MNQQILFNTHPLFEDVQMHQVFPDGKTFVDCIPGKPLQVINKEYLNSRDSPGFSLKEFVHRNFELPPSPPAFIYKQQEEDVVTHINNLWRILTRDADRTVEASSLLALPYPYIVPGGRFREIYYWDSYFTMLGLRESGEIEMIGNMIRNFAFLIDTYGHIPNGNRSYYLSRSQPPFFAAMVQLLASIKGEQVLVDYLPALEKEYKFWMDGASGLKPGQTYRRVVMLPDQTILNRYWDDSNVPRQESWREDIETAEKSGRDKIEMYKQLRAGAESGIDFSNRWFADGKNMTTIQTTNLIPVDLNALLYNLEMAIADARMIKKDEIFSNKFRVKANNRRAAIDKYCWNKSLNYYTDYNFATREIWNNINPAGMYPLCFFENGDGRLTDLAEKVVTTVRNKLLKDGGIVTTEKDTGQQWDAPNGWAPLQWMTIWGFDRNGQEEIAKEIAQRWVKLNKDVYGRTGKLMEKYNVVDMHLEAGGGEYPGQDGFGWTNGVLLALIKKYSIPQ